MNEVLIANWNQTVPKDGIVIHLGDVAMGNKDLTLPLVQQLNGQKYLISGNHDSCYRNPQNIEMYLQAGFSDVFSEARLYYPDRTSGGLLYFLLSHVPYQSCTRLRPPVDKGIPAIVGHVHNDWKYQHSLSGTPMVNVGVDVWDFKPVSLHNLLDFQWWCKKSTPDYMTV